jgi:hypothetical protein
MLRRQVSCSMFEFNAVILFGQRLASYDADEWRLNSCRCALFNFSIIFEMQLFVVFIDGLEPRRSSSEQFFE